MWLLFLWGLPVVLAPFIEWWFLPQSVWLLLSLCLCFMHVRGSFWVLYSDVLVFPLTLGHTRPVYSTTMYVASHGRKVLALDPSSSAFLYNCAISLSGFYFGRRPTCNFDWDCIGSIPTPYTQIYIIWYWLLLLIHALYLCIYLCFL